MTGLSRLAAALLSAGAVATFTQAQTPPSGSTSATNKAQPKSAAKSAAPRRQSIVHHNPYPYPEHYYEDRQAGFRNPGGVGRYAEYYPPGGHYQAEYAAPPPDRPRRHVRLRQRPAEPRPADPGPAARGPEVQRDPAEHRQLFPAVFRVWGRFLRRVLLTIA